MRPPSCALAGSSKRVKSTMVVVGFMIVDYPRSGITAAPSRAPIRVATWLSSQGVKMALSLCALGEDDAGGLADTSFADIASAIAYEDTVGAGGFEAQHAARLWRGRRQARSLLAHVLALIAYLGPALEWHALDLT
jgi:hypothetical protein